MSPPSPVIREAAINGVTTRKSNPSVPRTPDEIAGLALERGGHLRLGLEDYARSAASPGAGPGQTTNLELLEHATKLCNEVGRSVATPAQTAQMMHAAG